MQDTTHSAWPLPLSPFLPKLILLLNLLKLNLSPIILPKLNLPLFPQKVTQENSSLRAALDMSPSQVARDTPPPPPPLPAQHVALQARAEQLQV